MTDRVIDGVLNEHGVEVYYFDTGKPAHWDDKRGVYVGHIQEIPTLCIGCKFFESPDYLDEYTFVPSRCRLNIKFPIRKGTCQRFQPQDYFESKVEPC